MTVSQTIFDYLSKTDRYMNQLNNLSFDTAENLYDVLDDIAQIATEYIKEIDPQLRVTICDRRDMVLERIVDFSPSYNKGDNYKTIFSPALKFYGRWENVELMKDCGLVGYKLAKELGISPVMLFGTKADDYPYLLNLPGLEMLYNDSEQELERTYFTHLEESYSDMDILLLYGMYSHSVEYLNTYRKLRPDGKVYCGLDMNSYWMSTTPWNSSDASQFATQCDVIATSCRSMRDALNNNPQVSFACHWFTNGFYNPSGIPVIANPETKENIILTVGRIGTFQKNNEELLSAFAKAADTLESWSLRFIGSVENAFHEYIENYFSEYPHLKNRVIFTGPIADKKELYNEYAKAKIFALSSRQEGFPNVYAEALFHGCMFITSDIDAADDMTDSGKLGIKYPLYDVNALQNGLIELCTKADKHGMRKHINEACKYAEKYFDWNRNAKKLAYMLFK